MPSQVQVGAETLFAVLARMSVVPESVMPRQGRSLQELEVAEHAFHILVRVMGEAMQMQSGHSVELLPTKLAPGNTLELVI